MKYRVDVANKATGKTDTIEVVAPTMAEAGNVANARGWLVQRVVPIEFSDGGTGVWAVLFPPLGFLIGAIRLGNRDASGHGVIGVSLFASFAWCFVGLLLAMARAG
ncbi:MAG: hypothetical protein KDA89_25750 [Planctomycetaceae bacterium]|nr:hypothetical protein [Planctomycetaceae bacterium]